MARNRNRQAGPILRTIATPTPRPTAPSQNLGARAQTVAAAPAPVRRARKASMTGAQRDSTGRYSDWNRPASLKPFTTPMTGAWDFNHRTMPRGGALPADFHPDFPNA
jgi:hypothetical protein